MYVALNLTVNCISLEPLMWNSNDDISLWITLDEFIELDKGIVKKLNCAAHSNLSLSPTNACMCMST